MNKILLVAAVAAATLAVAACDKPGASTNSAYINSGTSATPAMPATSAPSQPATVASTEPLGQPQPEAERQPSTATATSDTASPNAASPAK
jgi:hypothetical protein